MPRLRFVSSHQSILESNMRAWLKKIMADDHGGEVMEYALIAGLIAVACIAVIGAFGTRVVARWTSVGSSM
jgi:Flp pilus assembly pilin Flp